MGKRKKWVAAAALFLLVWLSVGRDLEKAETPFGAAVGESLAGAFAEYLYRQFLPGTVWRYDGGGEEWLIACQVERMLPLYGMARREMAKEGKNPDAGRPMEGGGQPTILEYGELEGKGLQDPEDAWALMQEENREAANHVEDSVFTPHEKKQQVNLEELADYETLVKSFYIVDANTMVGSNQLNVDSLLAEDMTVAKTEGAPQILIYHTHSQEAFADSIPGDQDTTIMGVGERLAEILRGRYGYNVLHHTGQYDVETRDDAYGRALPELEAILRENPSIEVVIDLHRDQMAEDTRLVMDLDGRPTARFMFFNGLSRTKNTGDISYLKNENIGTNLAFSFQMQRKAEEYYPGLARKIYLKGYRYNMHLCPKSLLIELGAQNNTVEEAMNACDPLAHVLNLVLSGED